MAAPSGTTWGSVVYGSGEKARSARIGLYTSVSSDATTTTVNVEIWFWSMYSVDDAKNTLYYNNLSSSGSATTSVGAVTIKTTVADGVGWDTANQKKLKSYTYEYKRGTSAATRYLYAKLSGVDRVNATMNVSKTVSIPALAKYTVSYDANGGSGAPANQTKYHSKALTLSSTKPTRNGYTFLGWSTSKTATTATYTAGGSYTTDASDVLYAVWKANTYDITFDANGGSGAPAKQTKTYGVTLTLSGTTPKRDNYKFLGWSTSKTATTATYIAGGSYTANTAATLYAVWELAYIKPTVKITSLEWVKDETTGDIIAADMGFSWSCMSGYAPTNISVVYECPDVNPVTQVVEGTFTQAGNGNVRITHADKFDPEATYTFTLIVTDNQDSNSAVRTMNSIPYTIHCRPGGKGIAFGKSSELEGLADIGFQTRLMGGLLYPVLEPGTDLDEVRTPNTYVGANVSSNDYQNCPLDSDTFTLEVISCGEEGQVMQRLSRCHKTAPQVFERTYYTSSWNEWSGGWIYPELTSSFVMYGTSATQNAVRYRRDGRMVEIRGVIKPAADITGNTTQHTIFTLPEGYRPSCSVYVVCQGSGACSWMLQVMSSGNVTFSRYRDVDGFTDVTSSGDGTWLPFQAMFFVN